ncbi:hypothetical protein L195_g030929 [Trifolium pratense]|uniref:Uncharacterized protein n=1 Tax=Trifolium pratense TaxID=57577 RepID=A0A2K3L8Z3_TRIPR|nr:hypothetical protein L195_g030929 [Trifolium pratense]
MPVTLEEAGTCSDMLVEEQSWRWVVVVVTAFPKKICQGEGKPPMEREKVSRILESRPPM